MQARHLLVGVVDYCRRHAGAVVLAGLALAAFSGVYVTSHLGLSSETDLLFSADLPWRKRAVAIKADFPQHQDLLVAVIDAREPATRREGVEVRGRELQTPNGNAETNGNHTA